jgi:peroxiredoxin
LSLATGDKIQEFVLKSDTGEKISLTAALGRGPVVLAFFPFAFTGVCTAELCEFRDTLKEFESLNAQVFGISVDSRFALRAYSEQQGLNFPLLSDFHREVGSALGIMYDESNPGYQGAHKRSVFVVRPDRSIAYHWSSDDAQDRPTLSEIKEALAAG